jgi:ferredoxin-NADP reductase
VTTPSTGRWQQATVVDIWPETPAAKTFRLKLAEPGPHLAGQHYVVRLTAPDGYRAQRSYSVASAPGGDTIDLTVELLPDGEVSSFLHEVVVPGDELEVRGPIGGYFAWHADVPVLGVGGGSGVVPLMAMLRQARALGTPDLVRLVVSVRRPELLYYSGELPGPQTTLVYTRTAPPGFARPVGRIAASDLTPSLDVPRDVYVCGSPAFCDGTTAVLLDVGVPTQRIKVERFGPSG